MKAFPAALRSLALVVATVAAGDALAIFRAYVSTAGSDSNPCTLPAPCRLLPAALAVVDNGGEVWMLDSANYNTSTVSITKPVTILAVPGVLGSVLAIGGAALSIDAPSGAVKLRNLVVRSMSPNSGTGISVVTADTLFLEGVTLEGLGTGLTADGSVNVAFKDAVVRGNSQGVYMRTNAGAQQVLSLDGSHFFDNQISLTAVTQGTTGSLRVDIDRSTFNGPGHFGNGMASFGGGVASAAPVRAQVTRSKFLGRGTSNGTAITAYGVDSIVTISDSTFFGFPSSPVQALNGPSGVGILRSLANNTVGEGSMSLTGGTIAYQ